MTLADPQSVLRAIENAVAAVPGNSSFVGLELDFRFSISEIDALMLNSIRLSFCADRNPPPKEVKK